MNSFITYSLQENYKTSDNYYGDIRIFTNEVIKEIEKLIPKDKEGNLESFLEFLLIGVLWKEYINNAIKLRKIPKWTLIKLAKYRNSKNKVKVDICRGILAQFFLHKKYLKTVPYTIENFNKLITWLEATGEFNEEVKKLREWEFYLKGKTKVQVEVVLKKSNQLVYWFEESSNRYLGKYTINVEKFREENIKEHKWKEDYIYCNKGRIQYHLNMVGAEMLNRFYREDFLKVKERILLLPVCIRENQEDRCKAIKTSLGYKCVNCTLTCNISKLSKLKEKYNFEVYIIPHESDITNKGDKDKGSIGIVGVACVLNLISGGWKAEGLGWTPQCVLLDYCGCKSHWHESGIITNININKLINIIG